LKGSRKWFAKNTNQEGQPITLGANRYAKGLMLAPPDNSDKAAFVEYAVPPECRGKCFKSVIGLEQSAGRNGSVAFRVKAADAAGDWQTLYESPVLTGGGDALAISVPLPGKARLRLECCGGQSIDSDHAVWADVRLE